VPGPTGAGVLAVGTYDNGPSGQEGTYLVSAASGKILTRLAAGRDFAESTFADGRLFTANVAGVSGWAPG
jgi:hypothetical protein